MGVKLKNLSFSYGGQQVLDNISCTFQSGSVHAILGVNGAGKSTLINLLAGFLKPDNGAIFLDNNNLQQLSLSHRARNIAYVPQQQQLNDLTVSDYLLLGRTPYIRWQAGNKDETIVFSTLEKLKLNHLALRPLHTLSGGELQKTSLARALVQQPKVLLLDEPSSSLDMKNQLEVMEIIVRETVNNGLTTIITMHDVNLALRFADNFILMKDQRMLASGGIDVMSVEYLSELYGLKIEIHKVGESILVMPE